MNEPRRDDRPRPVVRRRRALDSLSLRAAAASDRARCGGAEAEMGPGGARRRAFRCRSSPSGCSSRPSAFPSASTPTCSATWRRCHDPRDRRRADGAAPADRTRGRRRPDRQLGGRPPQRPNSGGLGGQFAVGLLLGAVWSPCVGPTLGAASLLAAQGRDLGQVALTMFVFGLGAALPLLALGLASREVMMRWRHRLAAAGHGPQDGLRRDPGGDRRCSCSPASTSGGDRAGRGVAAMAHRPHDTLLCCGLGLLQGGRRHRSMLPSPFPGHAGWDLRSPGTPRRYASGAVRTMVV